MSPLRLRTSRSCMVVPHSALLVPGMCTSAIRRTVLALLRPLTHQPHPATTLLTS